MDNDAKLISEAYDTSKGLHRDGKITVAQLKQEYSLQGDEQMPCMTKTTKPVDKLAPGDTVEIYNEFNKLTKYEIAAESPEEDRQKKIDWLKKHGSNPVG